MFAANTTLKGAKKAGSNENATQLLRAKKDVETVLPKKRTVFGDKETKDANHGKDLTLKDSKDKDVKRVSTRSQSVKPVVKPVLKKPLKKDPKKEDEVKAKGSRVKPNVHQTAHDEDVDTQSHVTKKVKTVEEVQDWDDLDAEDGGDPVMVSEYVTEIFEYMRELEVQTMPDPNYMDGQKDLQWKMRSILVDWLVEVHYKFRLLPETLYLSINLIDRFLSKKAVSLVKLQLVGVTAMFVAAKFEEVVAPTISNFLYMADGGYVEEEILKAERYLLQVLDFGLQYPSPMSFLRRCSKADGYDIQTRTLAKYLMEVTLLDSRFLVTPPSMLAAAGIYLARHMLDRGEWNANLTHYAGYKEEELYETVDGILEFLSRPVKYEAMFKKYSNRKFMKGALFAKDWIEKKGSDYRITPVSPGKEESVKAKQVKESVPLEEAQLAPVTRRKSLRKKSSSSESSSASVSSELDPI